MPPQTKDKFGNYTATDASGFSTSSATPITAQSLAPANPITLPTQAQTTPPDLTSGQAVIDAQMKGAMTTPPESTPAPVKEPTAIEKFLNMGKSGYQNLPFDPSKETNFKNLPFDSSTETSYQNLSYAGPKSLSSAYDTAYAKSGLSTYEQDVLDKQKVVKTAQSKLAVTSAKLGAINAEATQAQLALEGTGRGQTTDFLNRQSSEIRKQAAIKALPLQAEALMNQAEIQSAQGDVELAQNTMKMAKDKLNDSFSLQSKDIENEYNYNKDLRDKVYEYATAKEKAQLDAIQKEDDRNFDLLKINMKEKADLANTALEAGQASLAARITQLDPKDPAYTQKFAEAQAEIKPKVDVQGERMKALQIKKLEQEINQSGGSVNSNVDVSKIDSTAPANVKNTNAITAIIRGNTKIGQGTKTSLSNLLGVVASAEDMATSHPDGSFTGLSPFRNLVDIKIPFTDINIVPFREAGKRTATIQSEEYINGINLRTQIWASGAALTKEQTRQVEGMVPKVTDTDRQVKVKLNELTNFMLSQAKSVLQSEGIDFQPEKVNLFETADLLKSASPEQKAELEALGLI